MKQWYQVAELSGLPGVPTSIQGILKKAKREQWVAKYSQAQGGGKEYHVSWLPAETQAGLHFSHSNQSSPTVIQDKDLVIKEQVDQKLTDLKDWQREIFHARVALYHEFEQLQGIHGTNRAIEAMIDSAKEGTLPEHLQHCVPKANARKGKSVGLSRSLILGWQRAVRRYGISALAPAKMEKVVLLDWAPAFMACYQLPSNPTIPEALELMEKNLPEGIQMPSYSQVLRWHNKRSILDREKGRRTGSAYRALKGYRRQDTSNYLPLQECQCDGHTFKARVANPRSGDPFQPEICTVIDLATKMVIGWSIGLAESAETVASAIRHAVSVTEAKPYGGMIRTLNTDGGSGNRAKVNSDELTGLYARLGMHNRVGIPGNPQGRGAVERLNATLWIRAAKHLETCSIKKMDKLAKRKTYLFVEKEIKATGTSSKLLSWPQFREFCGEQVDDYNRRPHSSLPKMRCPETGRIRHMSPAERWCWHLANGWDHASCLLTEQEIEVMWLPRKECTVIRGVIRLHNNEYYNKELSHFAPGTKVQVAWYQHDPERVQVWDKEGRMVCYALWEKNRYEAHPVSKGEMDIDARANARRKIKEMDIERIERERQGSHDLLPSAKTPPLRVIKTDRKKLAIEMNKVADFEIPHSEKDKYRLWQELDRRLSAGESLEDRAFKYYESFQKSVTFQSFVEVEAQLGRQEQKRAVL